jgi:IclR family transcriptional regulator, acetate operon repressor
VIRRKSVGPKADHDADARDSGAQSVDRAADHRNCCQDRLISRAVRTGLSTSTEYRLLTTLEKYSFVRFDRTESKWRVDAQSFAVRATFTRRRNVVAQAIPYLRGLRDQTRETANLAVVDNESIMVLTRVESREITRSLTKGRPRLRRDSGLWCPRQGCARQLFGPERERDHSPPRYAASH